MKMPNSVCWNITRYCNDTCRFCYRDKNSADLGFGDRKLVIDKVAEAGIKKLTFAGGEPLLVPGIESLITYAKGKGLLVSLTTNGILLKEGMRSFCMEHLDWLTVSLDAVNPGVQSKMGRNPGHVARTLEILDGARNDRGKKSKIKINTVVSRINQDDITGIAEVVVGYQVARWKLFQFVPLRGDARKHKEEFLIEDCQFQTIAHEMEHYLSGNDVILSISGKDNIERAYFVIFPNGDIKISTGLQDTVLGNVLTDPIGKIWGNGQYCHELHRERTCLAVG